MSIELIMLQSLASGVNLSSDALMNISPQINWLVALFQAAGGFFIAYIIFNTISLIINRRKERELSQIKILLEKISKKINKK